MEQIKKQLDLENILTKAHRFQPLSRAEIKYLLTIDEEEQVQLLFTAARDTRNKYFGNKVFLYGFVYFSTWCRNDCTFCFYGASNSHSNRYRKNDQEILDAAYRLAESGVQLIDLTMGEDPFFFQNTEEFLKLARLIEKIKKHTGLPVMISPGAAPNEVIKAFKEAGADWYACYQETHTPELFNKLRLKQSYDFRLSKKHYAKEIGLLIEEGILTGIGDTVDDVINSLEKMRELKAQQVRVMSFTPQKGSRMENWESPSRRRELLSIAVMRLLFPNKLIPASLDVDGITGLQERIMAGANVVTSIIPPNTGLAGVSRSLLDINEGFRTVEGVIPLLEILGLIPATVDEYSFWLNNEKNLLVTGVNLVSKIV